MKKYTYLAAIALIMTILTSCIGKSEKDTAGPAVFNTEKNAGIQNEYTVPDFTGKVFDTMLQQELSNSGYILSIKTEHHDTIPQGNIISQTPSAGTKTDKKGINLELTVSAGKKSGNASNNDKSAQTQPKESDDIQNIVTGLTEPQWIISPILDYDILETFGNGSYSIVRKWDNYGIVDINCNAYGTGAYTKLFHCPEHGLSSPDVTEAVKLADDLTIVPDCGFKALESDRNIYVYDDSRGRLYLTGYSDGQFKIADMTETEFFKTNSNYIAVLYNCDTDIMMYDGIGMESLGEIFKAENIKMNYGVVNNEFVTLIEFRYDEIKYGNDCYIVKEDGKYGYRGFSGQYYYECIFEEANTAYLGAAWVKYDGKWGTVEF